MGRHFSKVRGPRSYWAPSNKKSGGPGPPSPPGSDAYDDMIGSMSCKRQFSTAFFKYIDDMLNAGNDSIPI